MRAARIPEISVVILCYKSGEYSKVFHKKVVEILTKNKLNYQVVLVGNYKKNSNDVTPEVINSIALRHKNTVAIAKNKSRPEYNMGWDMRMGFREATGDTIAVIDGDGQMIPGDIIRLYKKLKKGDFDICKTKRVVREDGIYRKIISFIFNLLMQLLFPGIVSDINGKPKIFTREVYEKFHLVSNDWFIDAEIMIKARKMKFKIGELSTSFHRNPQRKSFITFSENFEFLKNILKWRVREFIVKK